MAIGAISPETRAEFSKPKECGDAKKSTQHAKAAQNAMTRDGQRVQMQRWWNLWEFLALRNPAMLVDSFSDAEFSVAITCTGRDEAGLRRWHSN